MALFRRKKTQTISELEDYYANRNNRAGVAWLMAFLSLLVTMVVIAGLFFGGRWVYRSLRGDDDTTKVATTTSSNENKNNSGTLTVEPEGRVTEGAATTDVPSSERKGSSPGSNPSSTNSTSQSPATTDGLGVSSTISNTGAGNIIYILPLSAMVLGYVAALRRQRN